MLLQEGVFTLPEEMPTFRECLCGALQASVLVKKNWLKATPSFWSRTGSGFQTRFFCCFFTVLEAWEALKRHLRDSPHTSPEAKTGPFSTRMILGIMLLPLFAPSLNIFAVLSIPLQEFEKHWYRTSNLINKVHYFLTNGGKLYPRDWSELMAGYSA